MIIEQAKTLILKKHINTIHCSNQFTLVQRKIFNALLFNAYNQLNDHTVNLYSITAKNLCLLTGYNSNDYEALRKDLLVLMSTVIHWDVISSKLNKSRFEEITIVHLTANNELEETLRQWLEQHNVDDMFFVKLKNIWEVYKIKNSKKELDRKSIKPSSDIEIELNKINTPLSIESIEIIQNSINKAKLFGQPKWSACPALGGVVFSNGVCTYEYSSIMRELLYHPEYYGRVEMEVQAKFKSVYGLVLYENCIRYQSLPYTSWLTIDQFRLLMGVKPGTYSIFRDLQTRVINKSVMEVNSYSSLEVAVELKKTGRNVSGIRFKINRKKDIESKLELTENTMKLDEKLKSYGVSKAKIDLWISSYKEEYLFEKINLIQNSSTFKAGKVRNVAGLLEKAITEDYKEPRSSKSITDTEIKSENENQIIARRKRSSSEQKYRVYKHATLIELYKAMMREEQEDVLNRFEDFIRINSPHVAKNFLNCQKDILNKNVIPYFLSFLTDNANLYIIDIKSKILSYEEFLGVENL